MSLLEKELMQQVVANAGKKLKIRFYPDDLNQQHLQSVGKSLATTTARSTVKDVFVFASGLVATKSKGILDGVNFSSVQRVFAALEAESASDAKRKTKKKSKQVTLSILRWNILLLSDSIVSNAEKGITRPEHVINALLSFVNTQLTCIFPST